MKCHQVQPGEPLFLTPGPREKSMREITDELNREAQARREAEAKFANQPKLTPEEAAPSGKITFVFNPNYGRS
jgi:hypothetical protein